METNVTNWTGVKSGVPGPGVGFGFVTIVPGVAGNTIAIVLFSKAVRKIGYAVHCLLLALSITDLVGCFLAGYTAVTAYIGDIDNPIACNIVMFITSVSPMSTALVACLLALDRYVALCRPFTYKKHASRKIALFATLLAIGASILISILPFVKLGKYYTERIKEDGTLFVVCSALKFQEIPRERIYGVLYGTVGILAIATVIVANALVIGTVLRMRKTFATQHTLRESESTSTFRAVSTEVKFAKMVVGISLLLLVCWTPYMVVVILVHCGVEFSLSHISSIMILASLNFIVDPFVHIASRRSYRQAVWRNVCCCQCFRDSVAVTTGVPISTSNIDRLTVESVHL